MMQVREQKQEFFNWKLLYTLKLLMVTLIEEIKYVLPEKWETKYRENLLGKAFLESLENPNWPAIINPFEKLKS